MKGWMREYFSIPNLLGYFRLILAVVYLAVCFEARTQQDYYIAAGIIGISMLSDFLDGKIARHFNMITNWGKILDPVADKVTLGVVAVSFSFRYPLMRTVVLIFIFKELFMGASGLLLMRKGWRTGGATWPGKICTAGLYIISFVLLLFPDLKILQVNLLMVLEIGLMFFALVSYIELYARVLGELRRGVLGGDINMKALTQELRQRHRKYRWAVPVLLILFCMYLLVGAVLPFTKHPEVKKQTKGGFDVSECYGSGIGSDRARILEDNGEALDERIRLIAGAKERIILSTFDFRADDGGLDILAALLDAADRGVQVEVFADGFNSWVNMEGNPYFYALSSHPNGKIILYNKLNPLKPWNIMGRMHDKYVIADDTAYILGGRNIFNYFLGDYKGHKNYDRDILVYHAGQGESSLKEVEAYYRRITSLDYCSVFHDKEKIGDYISVRRAGQNLRERFQRIREEKPQLFEAGYDYREHTYETRQVHLLSNPIHRYAKEPVLFYEIMALIEAEPGNSVIHTPYAICNDYMYQELSKAGKKVRMMQNSAANNGNMFAAVDYLRNKGRLIDTGIQLLEYEGGVSYHGKSVAVGEELSLFGSFNMDMRSAYIDTELMLAVDSPQINRQLRKNLESYEEKAAVVETESEYSYIPEGISQKELSGKKKAFQFFLGGILERLRFLL